MHSISEFFIFFFECVCFFMAVFFFLQYAIMRKPEYFWYSSYLMLLTIYYLLAIPEIFFSVKTTNKDVIAGYDLFKRPVQFFISVCYSWFVIYYLGLRSMSSPLYRLFIAFLVIYIVLALLCLAGNIAGINYDPAYYIISLLLFPLQMYAVIALFRYKVPYARFIIWGSINVLVGSTVTLLLSLQAMRDPGGPVNNANSYVAVMLAILADIFLFTIALQRKIADNEKSLINAAYNKQQAILLERERIIADLHDDVGGGLSSIRMMSDLMVQQQDEANLPKPNFPQRISSTAKEIAQRMNTIIWSLNQENDSLENFVEYVRQYGVSFFENSSFRFRCVPSENLPLQKVLGGAQRKNLFLIIKEALHNALKHSGADNVVVNIYMQGTALQVQVQDDGRGMGDVPTLGDGKKNMKKRAEEINGSLHIESNAGTSIHVSVPI